MGYEDDTRDASRREPGHDWSCLAAPAHAGCETNLLGALYCDGPVRPDRTWDRCVTVFGKHPYYKCWPLDPAQGFDYPLGQPPYHIYP